MPTRVTTAFAFALSFVLVACGGDADVELDPDTAETVDQIEDSITQLGEEIEASELQADLESAWDSVDEELSQTVDSIRAGEAIDTDAIEQQMEEFQQTLESVDAEQDLRDAWTELRADLQDLMEDVG
jgi:hypothetical protein